MVEHKLNMSGRAMLLHKTQISHWDVQKGLLKTMNRVLVVFLSLVKTQLEDIVLFCALHFKKDMN